MMMSEQIAEFVILLVGIIGAFFGVKKSGDASKIEDFFDPTNDKVTNASQVTVTPKSWAMSDETKEYIIKGLSPVTQGEILKAISEAEGKGLVRYVVPFKDTAAGKDGFWLVEYGLVYGGSYHQSYESAANDPRIAPTLPKDVVRP